MSNNQPAPLRVAGGPNTADAGTFGVQKFVVHFEVLAETDGSIEKIRELVVTLAVQGKLGAQDPSEEPASNLLKRIARERALRVRPTSATKLKSVPPTHPDVVPFSLPTSWCWARFVEVASIASNLVSPSRFPDVPHIAPDNIEK